MGQGLYCKNLHATIGNIIYFYICITYDMCIIYRVKGKGDMETYWLQSAISDKMKEENGSSDEDEDDVIVEGLLVTSI